MSTQPHARKARRWREIQLRKSVAGVAARERKRRERNAEECGNWPLVRSLLVCVHAAPDGRSIALRAHGLHTWERCGTERAVRGALARMLWKTKGSNR